ncbi:energy coupling factor transporter S component ThiW [Clostridium grantii]|uniref:Energy coupling factor transporter S component ThiW n=1 Tax=Clostridium grantii DSM 8605 TaxID=1121316 RepID=A0A1M5V3P4_9CLOT|nr:energy coupling factor transporter S component ThiW [Clostridium grantii]SHH69897.1 energy coupling factor transporter S component ThiW [Clostridium grantii DSM 8605]
MKTKKLVFSSLLVALGIVTGSLVYFPVGVSKCFPMQHFINVFSAITLGPIYSVCIAFCISLMRNILGTGSLLAFPGSMIGAYLSAILYKHTKKYLFAVFGEIIGTGIIGGIIAYPVATLLMGKSVALFFFVIPFLISTTGGSTIAYLLIKALDSMKILKLKDTL